MTQILSTPQGKISFLNPSGDILRAIRCLFPLGMVRYEEPIKGADFGLVMKCGIKEAFAIKMQPIDCDEKQARINLRNNSYFIAQALKSYTARGFAGLLMPCPYLRKKEEAYESGIVFFGSPHPDGIETLDQPFNSAFDNQFGHGFTEMVTSFIQDLQNGAKEMGVSLFQPISLDIRYQSDLGHVVPGFIIVGPHLLALKTVISEEDPVWTILCCSGWSKILHMPSVLASVHEDQEPMTKSAEDCPLPTNRSVTSDGWPKLLWPIRGCRLLHHEVTESVYQMQILEIDPNVFAQIIDSKSAQSWFDFVKDSSLSKTEKVAGLQRCVLLDSNNAGWWYTLACHYELEGKDWYGAANAFNHVIFLNPQSANAWFSLSQLWAHRGIMSKARECQAQYEKLTETLPPFGKS